jgi:hypothetical protein
VDDDKERVDVDEAVDVTVVVDARLGEGDMVPDVEDDIDSEDVSVHVTDDVRVRDSLRVAVDDRLALPELVGETDIVDVKLTLNDGVTDELELTVGDADGNATRTGELRVAAVPSPSCPSPFKPQHFTLPSIITLQECQLLATTLITSVIVISPS